MHTPTGELRLGFRKKKNGKTFLARQYYDLPLQVFPPYYQDADGTAFVYLLNPTGGVLQGDRLLTEIEVETGAKAVVTTPSANKLYKMEDDHAEIMNIFQVRGSGVLEFMPEYNIPYAGSCTYQNSLFYLDGDSTLFAWDMVTPGRIDLGEYFDYRRYSSKIMIYVDGKLEAYEYAKLDPSEGSLDALGVMEGYDVYATIFIYRRQLPEDLQEELRALCESRKDVLGGVSYVNESLACIKLLGARVSETREAMMEIWDIVRKLLLHKRRVKIRKY